MGRRMTEWGVVEFFLYAYGAVVFLVLVFGLIFGIPIYLEILGREAIKEDIANGYIDRMLDNNPCIDVGHIAEGLKVSKKWMRLAALEAGYRVKNNIIYPKEKPNE